ncbi:hypothetical protein EVAR_17100_1 [Eumeta japonica]|uniref:Uncharacterized protein n=1 Tax=Eumeta variegata TaxID=151549 RepID=A0A4C1UMJ7_EUMVA|nr:hypothetical protein EVAR_17100_1 [Eumeta japonica]
MPSGDISASPMTPDDARRYLTDVYISSSSPGGRPIAYIRQPDVSKDFEGASWITATHSYGDVPLGDVASAANFKNITESRHPTSKVGLHNTPSAAERHPGVKDAYAKKLMISSVGHQGYAVK